MKLSLQCVILFFSLFIVNFCFPGNYFKNSFSCYLTKDFEDGSNAEVAIDFHQLKKIGGNQKDKAQASYFLRNANTDVEVIFASEELELNENSERNFEYAGVGILGESGKYMMSNLSSKEIKERIEVAKININLNFAPRTDTVKGSPSTINLKITSLTTGKTIEETLICR